jgi:glycosyltransferase involved in cell wall biosynthesis
MKHAALYICYYDVEEPLVQTQVISYLRELVARGFEIHLLTFEKARHTAADQVRIRGNLAAAGIRWHALRYHSRPSLPATLYDVAVGTLRSAALCLRFGLPLVHARSHVPALMGLLLKRLLGRRLLFDVRGLLADEYADSGHWRRDSLKYRLTKGMESRLLRAADGVVVLTRALKHDFVVGDAPLAGREPEVSVIPCCVDAARYPATEVAPAPGDRMVFAYVGKLGVVYRTDEVVRLFAAARALEPRAFLQVYTQSDPEILRVLLRREGIDARDYDLSFAAPAALPAALARAHASLCLIDRGPAAIRAVSPTKLGESLAAGVPVIVNAGIGDCDALVEGHGVGVVVHEMTPAGYRSAVERLLVLLRDAGTRARCREVAVRELSLANVGGPRYAAAYERILGTAPR